MADRYLVATGNWSSTSTWSDSSGGSAGFSAPVAGDNVYLDANSGAVTLTVDTSSACAILDCTGFTGTLTGSAALAVSGNFLLVAGMTFSYSGTLTFNGTSGTQTVTSASKNYSGAVTVNGSGATSTVSLADGFTTTSTFTVSNGVFDANNQSVSCSNLSISQSTYTGIVCGSNTWNISLAITINAISSFAANTSTFVIQSAASSANVANVTFNNLTFAAAGLSKTWNGDLSVSGTLTCTSGQLTVVGSWAVTTFTPGTVEVVIYAFVASETITSNGQSFYDLRILAVLGTDTVTMNDALSVSNIFTHQSGVFETAGYSVTALKYNSAYTGAREFDCTNSTVTLTGTGTVYDLSTSTNYTLTSTGSTFVISETSTTAKTFYGAGLTFNHITFSGDNINLKGSNTFTNFNVNNAGRTTGLVVDNGTTQTITGNFTTNGSVGNLAKILSDSAGSAFTMTKSSMGDVSVDYMSIKDSTVDASPAWYAGANSTNVSGNTNWIFSAPPSADFAAYNGLAYASIAQIMSIAIANIAKVNSI